MARILGRPWTQRTRAAVACTALAAAVAWLFAGAQRGPRPVMAGDAEVAARVLVDLGAWDAARTSERRAAAVWVGATTPGMGFDRLETFGSDGHRHEMAVFVHGGTGLEFSLVPGGTFEMGSPEGEAGRYTGEFQQHTVTITKPLLLCRTECTQAAYERVTGRNPSLAKGADHPVETVSWDDAVGFCRKAELRLPTEAEWEYACRAGTTTRYWSGDAESDLARVGWSSEYLDPTHPWIRRVLDWLGKPPPPPGHRPVAAKAANPFGLHDAHGNVWEWCEDAWHAEYAGAPTDGSAGVGGAAGLRVIRGASFWDTARLARSAFRSRLEPGVRGVILGFRPARSVAP